jgi:cell division septation protein DedD
MSAQIRVPGSYGQADTGDLTLALTLTSRLTGWLKADQSTQPPPSARRWLDTPEWSDLLSSVVQTLTSEPVVACVADLAGTNPIIIRQPQVLHVVSQPPMPELLPPNLTPIPNAGTSHGAHLQADPALDLFDQADRQTQADRWLVQIGADAGLTGMERLVSQLRARPQS